MLSRLRRLPILFILIVGVSAGFLAFSYDHQRKALKDTYNLLVNENAKSLEDYSKLAVDLSSKQMFDELNSALEVARKSKKIDFYILHYKGDALWFGEKTGNLSRIDTKFPVATEVMVTPEIAFRSVMLGPDYQLTLGLDYDFDTYFTEQYDRFVKSIAQEVIYVLLIIVLVGIFSLRDLRLIVREVKRGKKGNLSSITARSAEANLFMKGLTGYTQAISDLEAENLRLGRQVLPSLQKEIHSGRKPPYDFECTMVRTDINHFSTIFNTHNVTEFMATINQFFDEVSRIVARYGGLVHEFVGDEVIYYFKDEEHRNSFAIALSAIRDINEVAARYHESTLQARGYPFTVKSSLAHGKVRFGPLVNGFTVAGSVLIETVRILGYITDRDENVVYFDGANSIYLKDVVESEERMLVKMKGYQNEIPLHQYVSHNPLKRILETLSKANVEELSFYRSNEDLKRILEDLRLSSATRSVDVTLHAIRVLRLPYLSQTVAHLGEEIRLWIDELTAASVQKTYSGVDKILSSVPMLYINLVPANEFANADDQCLTKLLKSQDARVVANCVEVLTHFENRSTKPMKPPKHLRGDLRILANSIILEGRDELSDRPMKKLKALLKSKHPTELASGLFALGELAQRHKLNDFAYFASHGDLQAMIAKLDVHAQHTATIVRRQALMAARKCGDEVVNGRIRHHVKDSGSELLTEELSRYLERSPLMSQKTSAA